MTLEDAKKLCTPISNIDGGCHVCIGSFIKDINTLFPEFEWRLRDGDDSDEYGYVSVVERSEVKK
jgi:hypothetical protein